MNREEWTEQQLKTANIKIKSLELLLQAKEAEIKKIKQFLFDEIILPNCDTCSNFSSNHCDNGIICMDKLFNGTFTDFKSRKLQSDNARMREGLERVAEKFPINDNFIFDNDTENLCRILFQIRDIAKQALEEVKNAK